MQAHKYITIEKLRVSKIFFFLNCNVVEILIQFKNGQAQSSVSHKVMYNNHEMQAMSHSVSFYYVSPDRSRTIPLRKLNSVAPLVIYALQSVKHDWDISHW